MHASDGSGKVCMLAMGLGKCACSDGSGKVCMLAMGLGRCAC